ncbi:MAG: hypothetical protein OEM25_04845 [Gammaproteobacteria bacterium]|nr:hypothetical protein [Gammaproteobacteria bacterium]
MKIGHILLTTASDDASSRFTSLVESLDRLAVDQHVLVAGTALARRLRSCPYAIVGPVVRTPVMACWLMPDVDLVHSQTQRKPCKSIGGPSTSAQNSHKKPIAGISGIQ